MLMHRVIPCLLLSGDGLVKTTRFREANYVGDPLNAIRIFNEKEVDELVLLDIEASKNGREPNYDLVSKISSECFMPLCYGGGIRSVEDAAKLFALGVEKISIQSAALENTDVFSRIADRFGSQAVVASIDIKRNAFGRYKLFSHKKDSFVKEEWESYVRRAIDAGAGEILLNAVDRDGTRGGMDTKLISAVSQICDVPLISMGGAATISDFRSAIDAGSSAVAAGAMFVYHGPRKAVLITYPPYSTLQRELDS